MSDNINEEIMNNLPDEENATDAIGESDDIEDIEDEIYTLTDEEGNEARLSSPVPGSLTERPTTL